MLEMPINHFIFQALTDFSVVINPGKKIALSLFPVALGFTSFVSFFEIIVYQFSLFRID